MTIDIPFADAFQIDPSPMWARLREEQPIARVRTLAGAEVWLVARYADVRFVLADPRFSRAAVVKDGAPRVALAKPLPSSLTTTDPPEHTRLRRLVSPVFAHRRIEQTRPWIRKLAEELAEDVARAGDGADLRELFALPLPIQVICELLGVPYEDRDRFREWTELGYSMSPGDRERVDTAMTDMQAYMAGLNTTGLLGELAAELSHDELVAFGVNLLVAGHETSANQIASCVATLLRFDLWEGLTDFELAVEELLRYNRFSEVGQLRVAIEDVEVAGQLVREGEGVMAALNAANRDPRAFEDPDELDLGRQSNQHLSFGAGPHFCLGAQLARIELQESLRALRTRFPHLKLAKPAEELEWRRVLVSGLAELPVVLG
ncbi:cytochrome P450 [Lentzea sp. NBRC 105346]|uniref:cytochrome P450 n=1 Tax=Lentzea sp. NBRC 105346 TaxID=3032205 RepID=UPI0024A47F46|nr:cytochrome P450 [Lentzea sp. NBRC 105346]GLZ34780.1 cytochrome P450 [Lentzea sp. NBRC 105346]